MEEEVVSTDDSKHIVQEEFVDPYDHDSELEREWRRRERKLIKQHKAEEKKIRKLTTLNECSYAATDTREFQKYNAILLF